MVESPVSHMAGYLVRAKGDIWGGAGEALLEASWGVKCQSEEQNWEEEEPGLSGCPVWPTDAQVPLQADMI